MCIALPFEALTAKTFDSQDVNLRVACAQARALLSHALSKVAKLSVTASEIVKFVP